MAKIRAKKLRKVREYDEMKYRPISWSEEMKEVARKDKNNPLAGQYLWMDDPTAPGSGLRAPLHGWRKASTKS